MRKTKVKSNDQKKAVVGRCFRGTENSTHENSTQENSTQKTQHKVKQDGNVPSRRHILGSKIFKEQLL